VWSGAGLSSAGWAHTTLLCACVLLQRAGSAGELKVLQNGQSQQCCAASLLTLSCAACMLHAVDKDRDSFISAALDLVLKTVTFDPMSEALAVMWRSRRPAELLPACLLACRVAAVSNHEDVADDYVPLMVRVKADRCDASTSRSLFAPRQIPMSWKPLFQTPMLLELLFAVLKNRLQAEDTDSAKTVSWC
jgi:hypothetical protein